MKKVVTSAEMRDIDKKTIKGLGIPGSVLMERAGLTVADVALKLLEKSRGNSVTIFCGKGNNGGDGFVAARELYRNSINVEVILFAEKNEIKGDALLNLNIWENLGQKIKYITNPEQLSYLKINTEIVIDALLGTGIKGKVCGILGDAIKFINQLNKPTLAIDMPSGLNADNGTFEGDCIKAVATVTMGLVKRGLILPPGKEYAGDVYIADIGFPKFVVDEKNIKVNILNDTDIKDFLPPRELNTHKGNYGKVFCLVGAAGYTGAAYMTCESMMKTGAGLVILGIPESINTIMEIKLTEAMTVPLPETDEKTLSIKGMDEIMSKIDWADMLVLGPGISRNEETQKLIVEILKKIDKPTIIDADGLYPFKDCLEVLKNTKAELVITPHDGEFARLFGVKISDIYDDRIKIVREKRKLINGTILLKGTSTITVTPDDEVFVNLTGNPGMASGGVGDILTGIIGGLAAQGIKLPKACAIGAFIHGYIGDVAAEEKGERPLTATDFINRIPAVFKKLNIS